MPFALKAGALAVLAAFATSAAAQDAAQTSPESVAKDTQPASTGLAEVIVTAQRRSESRQNAAVAVDVMSGDKLMSAGLTTATDIGKLMPALNVQNSGGANTVFFLRGVGNFTVNGYSDPAIAFNYDGVYLGRPTSTSGMFYDLVRMEALKGPQGTLYGRNATAGAINVIPVRPRPGQTSGFVTLGYGNYNAKNFQGAVNVGVGESSAFRISGNVVKRDGYMSDGTSDEESEALRVQFLSELSPEMTLRLSADYSHTGGRGASSVYDSSYRYNASTRRYDFIPARFGPDTSVFDPASQAYRQTLFLGAAGRNAAPLDDRTYQDNKFSGVHAEFEWNLPSGALTVIPAWRKAELDNKFGVPAFIGFIQETDKQSSLEARFAGKRTGMFDYIVGGFLYKEKVDGNYTFAQQALNAYQEFVSDTKSAAVFSRLTANLSDRFRLVGGLRYTQDNKRFDGQADVIAVRCVTTVSGRPSCPTAPLLPVTDSFSQLGAPFVVPQQGGAPIPISGTGAVLLRATTPVHTERDFDKVTYRIGAEYDLAPRSLLYATLETGFRSGGFSMAAGHETFNPEFIDAYTIGMKNRLFGNRLQLNVEAYRWKYRDQQVNHTGIDANGNQGQFTENIGNSVNQGVEVDVEYLITPSLLFSTNAQYLNAKYKDFTYFEPAGVTPPVTGCAYQLSPVVANHYEIDCSGKPGYQSPKWTINLGLQKTFDIGDNKLVASIDTQYKTSRYIGFQFLPNQLVDSNWRSNAQLTYGSQDNRWSLNAYVRNIEDDRSFSASNAYSLGSVFTGLPAAPRTFGLRLTNKF